jgi:Raf kinase inhibitor-like YbhB/YbcL family protein
MIRSRFLLALLGLLFVSLAVGCPTDDDDDDSADDDDASGDDDDVVVDFRMWSDDFIPDDDITHTFDCEQALPAEFACDNANPKISWEGAPEGTVSFVLIFDDPTAGFFPHWAIYNVPGALPGLDRGISGQSASGIPTGAVELENGFGWDGYLGSCPPPGVHHYRWRLWALSAELTDHPADFGQLEADATTNMIEMVEMCHVFDGAVL